MQDREARALVDDVATLTVLRDIESELFLVFADPQAKRKVEDLQNRRCDDE